MMRSTTAEVVGDAHAVPMGLTWVMVVEYTTISARSMKREWKS